MVVFFEAVVLLTTRLPFTTRIDIRAALVNPSDESAVG